MTQFTIESLQQRLQQLALERDQLGISFNQLTGAMLEIEKQIEQMKKDENPEEVKEVESV
tara:strand:+ start:4122 stop:4301 length:180 start_codon:yes stop_codon:yes gene_type:complete